MPGSWLCVVSEASSSDAPGAKSSGRGDHWALPAGSPWAAGSFKSSGCKTFWCAQGVVVSQKIWKDTDHKSQLTILTHLIRKQDGCRWHSASSGFRRKLQAEGWMGQRRTVRNFPSPDATLANWGYGWPWAIPLWGWGYQRPLVITSRYIIHHMNM